MPSAAEMAGNKPDMPTGQVEILPADVSRPTQGYGTGNAHFQIFQGQ